MASRKINMKLSKQLVLSVYLLLWSLLACAATIEPSEADLLQAYQQYAQGLSHMQTNILPKDSTISDNLKYQVHSVRKIGCEKALGRSGYVCNTMVTQTYPMQRTTTFMHEDRFIFDAEKQIWIIVLPPIRPNAYNSY